MKLALAFKNDPHYVAGRRDFFKYRDLGVTAATGGQMRAQVTSAEKGLSRPTGWHYHVCDMQLVYVLNGWIDLEFEDGKAAAAATGRFGDDPRRHAPPGDRDLRCDGAPRSLAAGGNGHGGLRSAGQQPPRGATAGCRQAAASAWQKRGSRSSSFCSRSSCALRRGGMRRSRARLKEKRFVALIAHAGRRGRALLRVRRRRRALAARAPSRARRDADLRHRGAGRAADDAAHRLVGADGGAEELQSHPRRAGGAGLLVRPDHRSRRRAPGRKPAQGAPTAPPATPP